MLDVEILRNEPERVKEMIQKRNGDPAIVDTFNELDGKWKSIVSELDGLRATQNELSKARDIEAAKKNKAKIKKLEEELHGLEVERELAWMKIPNLLLDDVPVGKDETENKPIRSWREPTKFDFEPKDHVELGELLDIIDIKRAAEVSGARFFYFKGAGALLEFALTRYAIDVLTDEEKLQEIAEKVEKGYPSTPFIPVIPPVMIRPDVYRKVARLSPEDEEEKFYIPKDDLYLVGSAEHTLAPLHMGETFEEGDLPRRYVGFSTCFRREAGSYGKDTRGILRVHQFDKLEMESFTTPEMSAKEQDFLVAIQEHLMQSLEIPYQVVAICTGDMTDPDARQIDIEAWMPAQGKYRETHTSDLMTDYQARRLGIKVKRGNGETKYSHMNDATALAMSRIPIAILENYQEEDGSVRIPEVLQKYIGQEKIVPHNGI